MPLCRGDRFVETYYTDRWYNVYEIYAHQDGHLRGWYCNVGCPAVLDGNSLSYIDLALDLLVFPDGRQLVLDEKEFYELDLPPEIRAQALAALAELQSAFHPQAKGEG
jgi:protein associated with RNAse G/E